MELTTGSVVCVITEPTIKMTVEYVMDDNTTIRCFWYNKITGDFSTRQFPKELLQAYKG
jgi:uncharacterized protein YodC (DUF2158 family)